LDIRIIKLKICTLTDTSNCITCWFKKNGKKKRGGHQHPFVDKVEELTSNNQLTSGYINKADT
jgi:hypothetical protein